MTEAIVIVKTAAGKEMYVSSKPNGHGPRVPSGVYPNARATIHGVIQPIARYGRPDQLFTALRLRPPDSLRSEVEAPFTATAANQVPVTRA